MWTGRSGAFGGALRGLGVEERWVEVGGDVEECGAWWWWRVECMWCWGSSAGASLHHHNVLPMYRSSSGRVNFALQLHQGQPPSVTVGNFTAQHHWDVYNAKPAGVSVTPAAVTIPPMPRNDKVAPLSL